MAIERVPIRKRTLADHLANRLGGEIRSGTYVPGQKLPAIMHMAHAFSVSHATVREALRKLESLGMVVIKHGSGVYVSERAHELITVNPAFGSTIPKQQLLDLVDARLLIESETVALAAVHATDLQLETIAATLTEAEHYKANDERAMLIDANWRFHAVIAEASGNTVLPQLQQAVVTLFRREQAALSAHCSSHPTDHQEHLAILDALQQRNPERARQQMGAHLSSVRTALDGWA